MWELGHMGIKTIAQAQGKLPNVLEYKNIDQVVDLIRQEEKKIGTIQCGVARQTRSVITTDDSWLKISFWK